jgi:hypothetical protein
MNTKQRKAAESMRKALDRCHKAGLAGGVYEYAMYVWPIEVTDELIDGGPSREFFDRAEILGLRLDSEMNLDGGSGA